MCVFRRERKLTSRLVQTGREGGVGGIWRRGRRQAMRPRAVENAKCLHGPAEAEKRRGWRVWNIPALADGVPDLTGDHLLPRRKLPLPRRKMPQSHHPSALTTREVSFLPATQNTHAGTPHGGLAFQVVE